MRNIIFFILVLIATGCSVDNYDLPNATLSGKITDSQNGELVESGGTNAGTVVKLYEGSSAQPINLATFPEGNFVNSKVFRGDYSYTAEGPFTLTFTDRQPITINKSAEIEIKVVPHVRLKASLVSQAGGTVTVKLAYNKLNPQALTELGVLWSTFRNPNNLTFSGGNRILDNVQAQNLTSGEKTYSLTGLKAGTTYYIRGIGRTINTGNYFNYSPQFELKIP